MIRFLCKSAFMLFLLLLAFAFFSPASENVASLAEDHSRTDVILAVKNTLGDLGSFCARNPETCQTGRSFTVSLGGAARDGAKMIYQFLDAQFSTPKTQEADSDRMDTGAVQSAF